MSKRFYITTAIPYVNGDPHIGFALECVQATCSPHRRLRGEDVRELARRQTRDDARGAPGAVAGGRARSRERRFAVETAATAVAGYERDFMGADESRGGSDGKTSVERASTGAGVERSVARVRARTAGGLDRYERELRAGSLPRSLALRGRACSNG